MQVTFIKPTLGRLGDGAPFVDEARMEPLQLGVLAGLTPPGVDVELLDDRVDAIDYDEPTDLVAITVESFTARRAYEIAAEYRARGVPVVMGGMHATLIPDEVAEHADAVFTGDAETLWGRGRRRRPRRAPASPLRRTGRGAPGGRCAPSPRPLRRQGLPAAHPPPVRPGLPLPLRVLRGRGVLRPPRLHPPRRRGGRRDPGPAAAQPLLRRRQPHRRSRGRQGAPAGARPAAGPLGLPGERRPGPRPRADAPLRGERLPGQRDRLREPGPREPAPDAQGPEPGRLRPLRRSRGHAPRPPPPDVGGLRPRLRPRHGRVDPGNRASGPSRTTSPSPPSTS